MPGAAHRRPRLDAAAQAGAAAPGRARVASATRADRQPWHPPIRLHGSTMMLLSVPQVAAELGLSPRQVRRLARQYRVGELVGSVWVLSRPDVHRLRRRRRPGRPKKAG